METRSRLNRSAGVAAAALLMLFSGLINAGVAEPTHQFQPAAPVAGEVITLSVVVGATVFLPNGSDDIHITVDGATVNVRITFGESLVVLPYETHTKQFVLAQPGTYQYSVIFVGASGGTFDAGSGTIIVSPETSEGVVTVDAFTPVGMGVLVILLGLLGALSVTVMRRS